MKKKKTKKKKKGFITCPQCENSFPFLYRVPQNVSKLAGDLETTPEVVGGGISSGRIPLRVNPFDGQKVVILNDLKGFLKFN